MRSQSLEAFIDEKGFHTSANSPLRISEHDLRNWMTDHVRVPVEVESDAARYRWLKSKVGERPTRKSGLNEYSEQKCEFVFPQIISWADFAGEITLDEAIDIQIESINASKGE